MPALFAPLPKPRDYEVRIGNRRLELATLKRWYEPNWRSLRSRISGFRDDAFINHSKRHRNVLERLLSASSAVIVTVCSGTR